MTGDVSRTAGFADARVLRAALAAAALIAQHVMGKALRDALFLESFGVERLPVAMTIAALASGALILGLSRATARHSSRTVGSASLIAAMSLLAAAWAAAPFSRPLAAVLVYLQSGALSAASVSVFWTLVSESFDPYTARAVVPRIMAGGALGGVAGGVIAWGASSMIAPHHLLLVAAALNAACLLTIRTSQPMFEREVSPDEAPVPWRKLVLELPYLRTIGSVVVLAALTQALLDYLLSAAAVSAIGVGPDLVAFFALFQTGVGVLSFGLQAGAARSALERWGVGPVLAVSPALLVLGSGAMWMLPSLAGAVILRGADGVLGGSLQRSAYEVLFAPVDPRERRAAKPLLDVGCDRLGTLLGSAIITGALAAGARTTGVLVIAAGLLAAVRAAISLTLQRGYRRELADNLREAPPAPAVAMPSVFDLPVPPIATSDVAPVAAPSDPIIESLRDLRSGDEHAARAVLCALRVEPVLARQVIELLGDDRLARDAADWLSVQEPHNVGLLGDALLSHRLSDKARRRVARLLGKIDEARAADCLLAALPVVPTAVRLGVAHALARIGTRRRLDRTALFAAVIRAASEPGAAGDRRALEEVFALLAAAYPREPVTPAFHALSQDASMRGTALEWLDVTLPKEVRDAVWPLLGRAEAPLEKTRDATELRRMLLAKGLLPDSSAHED